MGELGGQYARIAKVAACVAAAVAIENRVAAAVGRFQTCPCCAHAGESKFFIVHAGHRGSQSAEHFLTAALALQLFGGHVFRCAGAVQRLERAHQRVEPGIFQIAFFLPDDVQLGFHRRLP